MKSNIKKISLALIISCQALFASHASASGSFHSGYYAGYTGGYAHGYGKRSESGAYAPAPGGWDYDQPLVLTDNQSMQADATIVGFHLGYLEVQDDFVWAFEPGLSYGKIKNKITVNHLADVGVTVPFSAELNRRYNLSLPFKVGMLVDENLWLYGILGAEIGKYEYKLSVPDATTTAVNKMDAQKHLLGFCYGLGLAKDMDPFLLSLDFKCTRYQDFKKTFSDIQQDGRILASRLDVKTKPRTFEALVKVSYLL